MPTTTVRVNPYDRAPMDLPLLSFAAADPTAERDLITGALEASLKFAGIINSGDRKAWRTLSRDVAHQLGIALVTQSRSCGAWSLVVLIVDHDDPERAGELIRDGAVGGLDGIVTAIRSILTQRESAARAAQKDARIAATPDVPVCARAAGPWPAHTSATYLHTHACQRDCCVLACDFTHAHLLAELAEGPLGSVYAWVEEAFGYRPMRGSQDGDVLTLRDLLASVPSPGAAQLSLTGRQGREEGLSSLCEVHDAQHPGVLAYGDSEGSVEGFAHVDALRADLAERLAAELETPW